MNGVECDRQANRRSLGCFPDGKIGFPSMHVAANRCRRQIPQYQREMREKANLTQRELADKIDQSQWWIARSETGSRRIDVAEFIEFCLGCGVEPARALTELTRLRR